MTPKNPKVLIVDDEQVVCNLLREELSERGYLCTAVLSGNDALVKLAKEDFDVVLLDIRMPGMPGMDVLRETWLNHSHTAVIMITAVNDADTAVQAMKLGASDYIVKPFDLGRIDTSIRAALKSKPATDKSSAAMDAIARGVEAKLDPVSSYSKMVTQGTIDITRKLGISDKETQKWAAAKAQLDSKREGTIKSSLEKPESVTIAQG
jgi:DNA-binding NtrC family response regulator